MVGNLLWGIMMRPELLWGILMVVISARLRRAETPVTTPHIMSPSEILWGIYCGEF